MELSKDQKSAIEKIIKWYKDPNKQPFITLGGYAGTGKTTLIAIIKQQLGLLSNEPVKTSVSITDILNPEIKNPKSKKHKIAFCSYTGRATQNLKIKLEKGKVLESTDTISTIHGLIYKPMENERAEIVGWSKKDEIDANLIIVDEASMVDQIIWNDLLSFNIPILAVGDHGQLPPINGNFNLMEKPHLKLEEIHRQARGNPIIDVSIFARETGVVPAKEYGKNIIKYSPDDMDFHETSKELLENYNTDTLILCGYNITRNKINQFVRNALGFDLPEPSEGDRVICLRNNHKKGVYNGMIGTIINLKVLNEIWYEAEIKMDDLKNTYKGKIYAPQFGATEAINFTKDRIKAKDGDLFDFGYALTVHKAQGSQAKRVILFEERFAKMDEDQWRKWLYTGITRAESELFIF